MSGLPTRAPGYSAPHDRAARCPSPERQRRLRHSTPHPRARPPDLFGRRTLMSVSKWLVSFALGLLTTLAVDAPASAGLLGQQMVVANRGDASISVIDVATSGVTTFALPPGANRPEPMYVVYSPVNDLVFVGDRANNRVVAYNARTYDVIAGNIPTLPGVFHMWGNTARDQLWVANDTSRSVSVIDMRTFAILATIATPNDLGPSAIPHDVILDPSG